MIRFFFQNKKYMIVFKLFKLFLFLLLLQKKVWDKQFKTFKNDFISIIMLM